MLRELTENSRLWTCCAPCLHYWCGRGARRPGALPLLTGCGASPRSLTGGRLREGCGGRLGCGVGSSSWLAPRQRALRSQRRWPCDGVPVALDGPVLSRGNRKQVGRHDFRSSGGQVHLRLASCRDEASGGGPSGSQWLRCGCRGGCGPP